MATDAMTSARPVITRQRDVNQVVKPDGTSVRYYLFPECEVHYNEIPSGSTQQWHHHLRIDEMLYIIDGALVLRWRDVDGEELMTELNSGDLVRVGSSSHTISNESPDRVRFLVVKYVPDGEDRRDVFRRDKQLD